MGRGEARFRKVEWGEEMGYWGVRSYEVDEAHDALDAGFERVHGATYDDLMDDRNPMPFDQVQRKLASRETLAASVDALRAEHGDDFDAWDEVVRLGFAGVVVRHAELGVPIPDDWRHLAIEWLEAEPIDWPEVTRRRLRREAEIRLLRTRPEATEP